MEKRASEKIYLMSQAAIPMCRFRNHQQENSLLPIVGILSVILIIIGIQ